MAVHSSGELGIQLATMLHRGAVIPNLSFAADAHYHHLTDDVIEGGLMRYKNGAIRVPDKPGLGVTLNRDKLREFIRPILMPARRYLVQNVARAEIGPDKRQRTGQSAHSRSLTLKISEERIGRFFHV